MLFASQADAAIANARTYRDEQRARAGLGVSGVEKHQHRIRQVDDAVGCPERRRPLLCR